mgnify:FL=1
MFCTPILDVDDGSSEGAWKGKTGEMRGGVRRRMSQFALTSSSGDDDTKGGNKDKDKKIEDVEREKDKTNVLGSVSREPKEVKDQENGKNVKGARDMKDAKTVKFKTASVEHARNELHNCAVAAAPAKPGALLQKRHGKLTGITIGTSSDQLLPATASPIARGHSELLRLGEEVIPRV